MCLATNYLNQIELIVEDVKGDMKKLNKKLSQCDKNISKLYHDLEVSKFNACEGYYFAKNLQELLQKRRLVKSELHRLESIHNVLIQSVGDRLKKAKTVVEESKNKHKDWYTNFNISFRDIEEEVLN